ncbi:tissue factor-like [Odontesthes bonariensis]|uniref:tissue factor-like n=1 Tax=Odontesthes bonariensis TaxID=219752 RepID=UPI003F58EF7D
MASIITLLYMGVCVYAWRITTADDNPIPKAENVHWTSLDFTTILTWTGKPFDHTYTVLYAMDDGNWIESPDCSQISESVCDLTDHLKPLDRIYQADIKTEPVVVASDYDMEEFPHTYSLEFNPYRESNISAVLFTLEDVDENTVIVNITDPVTSIHEHGKQLSIRDILKNDLKYKISYYKSGSTGKRDIVSDSSRAKIVGLDAGQSYCIMVAAFIPSRPKATQQGAWSTQLCTKGHWNILQDLSLGAWIGAVFILLIVLIILITVTVICCRCQRNKRLQKSQSSAPV